MKWNREFADAYLDGEVALPGTFTTGFRRDLHLAREIIRRRTNGRKGPGDELPVEPLEAVSR